MARWFGSAVRGLLGAAERRGYALQPPVARLTTKYDDATSAMIRTAAPYTMTPPARLAALRECVRYVVRRGIPGALVECGVWRGGSMMAVATTLLELDAADRELWLYDTYQGMTDPTDHDRTADGRRAGPWIDRERTRPGRQGSGVFEAGVDEVRANLLSTGYPEDLLRLVAGPVEQTLRESAPGQVALLRLDTDFYASTRAELEHLYPRLAERGVLVLDDYGYWQGARRAVDEYFADDPPLLVPTDASGRVAVR